MSNWRGNRHDCARSGILGDSNSRSATYPHVADKNKYHCCIVDKGRFRRNPYIEDIFLCKTVSEWEMEVLMGVVMEEGEL
jgi:hypothetical protein